MVKKEHIAVSEEENEARMPKLRVSPTYVGYLDAISTRCIKPKVLTTRKEYILRRISIA